MSTTENKFFSSVHRRGRATTHRRDAYLRRFQLLGYREVMRLCDVIETEVPIHGAGNFPTLNIRPCKLVQLVRDRLELIGVKVHDIRLNGSAATHVLSDDVTPAYKDLDLIFSIDFPDSNEVFVGSGKRLSGSHPKRLEKSVTSTHSNDSTSSYPQSKKSVSDDCCSLDDSGYTSSGSSVESDLLSSSPTFAPVSKSLARTTSIESISSSNSFPLNSTGVHPVPYHYHTDHQVWQEIKDATLDILLKFLPQDACHNGVRNGFVGNAYVRKMVKVAHDSDRWSLISLNNNSGRNLELKFVQNMKRQFEFSVDSFQIILDTYLAYRNATFGIDSCVGMREGFHPTVVAESVYGDFAAALRHLRHRRICTHRPEEIRGGGLLRYCNLLARDFTPGEDDKVSGAGDISRLEKHMCARFFIDFSDIEQQRRKLIGYLESHFQGEDELKFQYLLILRHVVTNSTACLMQHERMMVLGLITALVRETFAFNVVNRNVQSSGGYRHNYSNVIPTQPRHETTSFQCSTQSSERPPIYSYVPSVPIKTTYSISDASTSVCYSTNTSVLNSKPSYYPVSRDMTQRGSCCWYCCHTGHCQASPHTPVNPTPAFPSSIQPIYYSSSNITCYYKPAACNSVPFM